MSMRPVRPDELPVADIQLAELSVEVIIELVKGFFELIKDLESKAAATTTVRAVLADLGIPDVRVDELTTYFLNIIFQDDAEGDETDETDETDAEIDPGVETDEY